MRSYKMELCSLQLKDNKINSVWLGLKAGIISSLCCLPAIILIPIFILLGVQSFALALILTKYAPYFFGLGILSIFLSFWIYVKRSSGKCDIRTIYRNKYVILTAILIQTIIFIMIYYML